MPTSEIKTIHAIDHHRNGVGGIGFHVVTFSKADDEAMIATVFPERGAVAVLSMPKLAEGNIRFGHNSWRGDVFEPELRAAIEVWESTRHERLMAELAAGKLTPVEVVTIPVGK